MKTPWQPEFEVSGEGALATGTNLIDLWDVGHDAAEALRLDEAKRILAPVFAAVRAHGETEGIEDYLQRAGDVAAGLCDVDWAWPFETADSAYISAVTPHTIVCEIFDMDRVETDCDVTDEIWEEISEEWCGAFERGYRAARAAE
jgi:hypothetical protein